MQQTCELGINERLFEKNATLVVSRWPDIWAQIESSSEPRTLEVDTTHTLPALIIDNIHLHSCFDTHTEVSQQLEHLKNVKGDIYCYGVGSGELVRELLRRYPDSTIHVVIFNPFVFKVQLAMYHWSDWLQDEAIQLHSAAVVNDVNTPWVVAPAELALANESSQPLVDKLQLELNTDEINRQYVKNVSPNIDANLPLIDKLPKLSQLLADAGNRFIGNKEVTVIGAGPSLDNVDLSCLNDQLIVCVDAAFKSLIHRGIEPHFVVAIDFSEKVERFLTVEQSHHSTLIAFPTLCPSVIERWQGPCYLAFSHHPVFHGLNFGEQDILFNAGSVIHPAIDLAVKLSNGTVNLIGADFCFEGTKTHAAASDASFADDQTLIQRKNARGELVNTCASLLSYALDVERYIQSQPDVNFVSVSQQGLSLAGVRYE